MNSVSCYEMKQDIECLHLSSMTRLTDKLVHNGAIGHIP